MIRSIRSTLAVLVFVAACTPVSRTDGPFAPKTAGYSLTNATVSKNGTPQFRVEQTNVDNFTTSYRIVNVSGVLQASITLASSTENTLECRADFPTLGTHFEVRYPQTSFNEVLASLVDNGVIADGQASAAGLEAYAASRGIRVVNTANQMARLRAASKVEDCRKCSQDYRRCQVDESYERAHPAPGVTVRSARACESAFQACSQGGILTRQDEWPCGAAPAP